MHQRGAQRERAKRAAEHDPGRPDSARFPLSRPVRGQRSAGLLVSVLRLLAALALRMRRLGGCHYPAVLILRSVVGFADARLEGRKSPTQLTLILSAMRERDAAPYPRARGRNRRRPPMSPRSRGS